MLEINPSKHGCVTLCVETAGDVFPGRKNPADPLDAGGGGVGDNLVVRFWLRASDLLSIPRLNSRRPLRSYEVITSQRTLDPGKIEDPF